ncbi:IclR family transcriptional regulator [Cupriavidus sp. L7L]|uniref:IclR family transcriptional regulator n=1 Tax=Cupriavidus sp. L7L TaxID=2546443 RepID=UPI001404EAAC|nr:IclR family transcriptional regulator [Cupriavidus sp. L7L]
MTRIVTRDIAAPAANELAIPKRRAEGSSIGIGAADGFGAEVPVRSLERGLRLLMEMMAHRAPMTAPLLCERLKLPRISVFRLLATLEATGCVERVGTSHAYRVGLGVLRLGFDQLASRDLTELSNPLLRRLSEETGYPSHLAVRDGRLAICVAKADPDRLLLGNTAIGTSLPAYRTVLGRALLAELTLQQLHSLYSDAELQGQSAQAIRTVDELFEMVRQEAERGYSTHEAGVEGNVAAVSAPVRSLTGGMVASLGIIVRSSSLNTREMEQLAAKVRKTAEELAWILEKDAASISGTNERRVNPQTH